MNLEKQVVILEPCAAATFTFLMLRPMSELISASLPAQLQQALTSLGPFAFCSSPALMPTPRLVQAAAGRLAHRSSMPTHPCTSHQLSVRQRQPAARRNPALEALQDSLARARAVAASLGYRADSRTSITSPVSALRASPVSSREGGGTVGRSLAGISVEPSSVMKVYNNVLFEHDSIAACEEDTNMPGWEATADADAGEGQSKLASCPAAKPHGSPADAYLGRAGYYAPVDHSNDPAALMMCGAKTGMLIGAIDVGCQ